MSKMIVLAEHYGYELKNKRFKLKEANLSYCYLLDNQKEISKPFNNNKNTFCFKFNKAEAHKHTYQFETGYYIGVDWIGESGLPIYVQPKLNKGNKEIDYLKMLFDALSEPENFNHLKDLYTVDFNAPLIAIEQQQDKLTPLLLLEFLQVVKQIVRKGLKKSYYKVTKNLNARVKGKIMINATVKQNHFKQKMTDNVCQYEEFGYNSIENRILKKALLFTQSALYNLKHSSVVDFKAIFNYISPAFQHINEQVDIRELKNTKANPLFKEYKQALHLAKLILKKYGYNISKTTSTEIKTPPFWIDMTKLFELYVFKKLREEFKQPKELFYHKKYKRLEPDYILNSKTRNIKMIIDAKYKPKLKDNNISLDDARQISGYARLKAVYKEFGFKEKDKVKEIIDCLVIYSDQALTETMKIKESFESKIEDGKYQNFYKFGIRLPEISKEENNR